MPLKSRFYTGYKNTMRGILFVCLFVCFVCLFYFNFTREGTQVEISVSIQDFLSVRKGGKMVKCTTVQCVKCVSSSSCMTHSPNRRMKEKEK